MPPGATRRYRLAVRGGQLAVLDTPPGGAAPSAAGAAPVLLVPGYTGSKEDFLEILQPIASAGHRVLTYDQRGQYESAGPAETTGATGATDPRAFTVEELAADLLALLGELAAGAVHLVGHSFGGLVARAAAIARPGALRSLTLMDSGPAAIPGDRADQLRRCDPIMTEQGPAAVWAELEQTAQRNGAAEQSPELADFLRRRFFANSPVGLQTMGRELLAATDRSAELAATGLPLLVLYGEDDNAWPPAVQADMARRLGARRAVVPAAVHSPAVEAPEATAAALLEFWRGAEAR